MQWIVPSVVLRWTDRGERGILRSLRRILLRIVRVRAVSLSHRRRSRV